MNRLATISALALGLSLFLTNCSRNSHAAAPVPVPLPTGQLITPLAVPGAQMVSLNPHLADAPDYNAGQAVTSVLSPDGSTLLVLTSGYNLLNFTSGPDRGKKNKADSNEYVFVYDVTGGTPRQQQVLQIPNTYCGIAFSPSGSEFYVSGGDDDNVHVFDRGAGGWQESGAPVALGHQRGLGAGMQPEAAGLAVSADGNAIVVADYENDAISLLRKTAGGWQQAAELDLRPGKSNAAQRGVPGGEYPYWVAVKGNDTAYVSSLRDRQVVVVSLAGAAPRVTARIALPGQPTRLLLDRAQDRLFVAQDNEDAVAVFDTGANKLLQEIPVIAPSALFADPHHYFGVNPNALALSPDETTLYVSNGEENAIAMISLNAASPAVTGLLPTAWYPNSVTLSRDGSHVYVVNGLSDPGPNASYRRGLSPDLATAAKASNEYILQLEHAGLQSYPTPAAGELDRLTRTVLDNDHLLVTLTSQQSALLAGLHQRIKHVIFILKENRTYDQVLGDLKPGNGDPALTEFPAANTPNFHALAHNFVTLDNFECSGGVSFDGWAWSTSGRANDVVEKEVPVNYANRGLSYETEGANRNTNLGLADATARHKQNSAVADDDDDLPGNANVAAPDPPGDIRGHGEDAESGNGYLWSSALRHGLTVRDYGFWVDGEYNQRSPHAIPEDPHPYADHVVMAYPVSPEMMKDTDPYFRGFDQSYPDYFRYLEWKREFDQYAAKGDLPGLELIRMEHDHFGNFKDALNQLDSPEMQIADDDYAVGLLIQTIAHSPFKDSTLIVIEEDDAQNGGDHVDAHRSPAFIIGPYVKHDAVVSTAYNSITMLRTIEEVLGLGPSNLMEAASQPMTDVFDLGQADWDYTATPSAYLNHSTLPFVHTGSAALRPTHDGAWWAAQTQGMDFIQADHLDSDRFNRLLWLGLKSGPAPQP